ncbi:uncharacterized protein LOC103180501 [Callorhinchus milii]|uniref:uncharacterized protein LOC103180501 n=1 Tax=Callorhinchus milii TaxID=7868 RepID=UPI000457254F|nr:uncharacterized protein LOC103180501 [Callorhinchus milii]|eukprot:gi/632957623/ref/XP_007894587.1/ PREDICTED: uncharacterized protein LOC103180501 [Callorhinchus milii]
MIPIIIQVILCNWYISTFITFTVTHMGTKHKMVFEASCQNTTIIDALKKLSYDLPHGIEQDVIVVSEHTELSVDFLTTEKSFEIIEGYRREIVKQALEAVSNQGYRLVSRPEPQEVIYLSKWQQRFALVNPIHHKQCLNLTTKMRTFFRLGNIALRKWNSL